MKETVAPFQPPRFGDGVSSTRQLHGSLALIRDPGLFAVVAVIIAAAIILPNPLDNEGGIDAFIYNAFSLNFSNLINRYGPWYFSYRSSHLFWLWLARVVVGYDHSQKALVIVYLSTIAVSSWVIVRPYLPRLGAAGLIIMAVLSPWTIKTVATSYLDATCVSYMFVLIALLILNKRADYGDRRLSFAAGCVLGLIVNANTSLVIFGGLIFIGHFAIPLERRTVPTLLRSGSIAVLGFFASTIILWVMWSAILVIGSGTPISAILRWTWISLHGGSWDSDMFSIAVGRAMAGLLTTDPRPFVLRMFRDGEVKVVFPIAIVTSIVLYRLWAVPKFDMAKSGVQQALREDWDSITLSAVLIVGYCYVSSESAGNQMLSAPFYFVYMLPFVYLSAALATAFAWHVDSARYVLGGIVIAASLAIVLYVTATFAPAGFFAIVGRLGKGMAWMIVVLAVVAPVPLWRPAAASAFILTVLALGGPLFLASGGYYCIPYFSDMNLVSRDILNAQKALIGFVESTAPPAGVQPNSQPVIFWYPNTPFMDSLSGTYLSDYQALDTGHTHNPRLPYLDERSIAQLKAGYRREIVFVYNTAAEREAAEKSFHDLGVEFDTVANAAFTGVKRSVLFTYIRVTKPPA